MRIFAAMMMAGVLALAGCPSQSNLERQTTPDRATFGGYVIATPPKGADVGAAVVVSDQPGEWKFALPANVREVVRKMEAWDRYALYVGVPQVTADPFMVITVGQDRQSHAEADGTEYQVTGKREYIMNGNIATEWTGQTNRGLGFCELIVRRPGTAGEKGTVCHAMATAKNETEQKIALGILGSIEWETTGE